jgi:hypothetical protein
MCPNGSFSFPILQSYSVVIGQISVAPNFSAFSNISSAFLVCKIILTEPLDIELGLKFPFCGSSSPT